MERDKNRIPTTVGAFNEVTSIYSKFPLSSNEKELLAVKNLSDGTEISICKYHVKDGSKLGTNTLRVNVNNDKVKTEFILTERGLMKISINKEEVGFVEKHLRSKPQGLRIIYDNGSRNGKSKWTTESFRQASRPLAKWLREMVINQKYSDPPVSIEPISLEPK